jgi:hypothetical protein
MGRGGVGNETDCNDALDQSNNLKLAILAHLKFFSIVTVQRFGAN